MRARSLIVLIVLLLLTIAPPAAATWTDVWRNAISGGGNTQPTVGPGGIAFLEVPNAVAATDFSAFIETKVEGKFCLVVNHATPLGAGAFSATLLEIATTLADATLNAAIPRGTISSSVDEACFENVKPGVYAFDALVDADTDGRIKFSANR